MNYEVVGTQVKYEVWSTYMQLKSLLCSESGGGYMEELLLFNDTIEVGEQRTFR